MKNHPEVTKIKKFEDVFKNQKSLEELKGKLLLFDKESKYYKYSGWVTAALFKFNEDGTTLLATFGKEWIRNDADIKFFKKMFKYCDVVIGKGPEDSFFIEA